MINLTRKIQNRLVEYIWRKKHKKVNREYVNKYRGSNLTIVSCNCIGGVLYHELGLQFLSPTINLYMNCEDFIKFCEKMDYYLSLEMVEYTGEIARDYPLGSLDDLLIYFVHYNSFEEAKLKWDIRKTRMNKDNIFIIASDRDGFTMELLERFMKLPYENKKLFSHIPHNECNDVVYIRGYEHEEQVEGLTLKTKGGHYLIDQFDWIAWLNGESQ